MTRLLPALVTAALLAGPACAKLPPVAPDYTAYTLAQFAVGAGDTVRAAAFLERALSRDPANIALVSQAFSQALTLGDGKAAVRLARQLEAARAESTGLSSMVLLIDALKREKWAEAEKRHEDLTGTPFDILVKPIAKAWALEEQGRHDEALAALDALAPYAILAEYRTAQKAYILDHAGRTAEADAAYKAILAGGTEVSLAPVTAYVAFLARNGRTADAEAVIANFEVRFPTRNWISGLRAKLDKPKSMRSPATGSVPALANLFLERATEMKRDQADGIALRFIRMATILEPDNAEAQIIAGDLLAGIGAFSAAQISYEQAAKDQDARRQARMHQSLALDLAGNTDAAINALQDIAQEAADQDVLSTLADLYRKQEKFKEAADYYSRALAAKGGKPEANDWFLYFARGICHERLKDWTQAEADLLKALELQSDEPQVLNYLGYSWIDRGVNKAKAREMIEKAVAARPNDGFIIDSLAWTKYLEGDYEGAVRDLERAVLIEPSDPTLNEHLGDAYWKAGRTREARFQWGHALRFGAEGAQADLIRKKLETGLPVPVDGKPA